MKQVMGQFVYINTEDNVDRYQFQRRDCNGVWYWDGWIETVPAGSLAPLAE